LISKKRKRNKKKVSLIDEERKKAREGERERERPISRVIHTRRCFLYSLISDAASVYKKKKKSLGFQKN
jgi:hypothetical protein